MGTTFELIYTITDRESWCSQKGLKIKSNLAEDDSVECDLPASLVKQLKEDAVTLKADKLLLGIAEAQKRAIETSYEQMNDMALQAKVNADTAHEALSAISLDADAKYEELEKSFYETEQRFKKHITSTTAELNASLDQLIPVKESLANLDSFSLDRLTKTLQQLIKLSQEDSEVLKLVLEHKALNKAVKEVKA